MIAPDWSSAPKWARFAAMDSSGAWYWYEERPAIAEDLGIWTAGGHNTAAHKFQGWQKSLSERGGGVVPGPSDEGRSVLRLTEAGRAYGVTLEDWLGMGWRSDTLVANGYAELVS